MSVSWSADMLTPAVQPGTAPVFSTTVDLSPDHGGLTSAVWHISSLGIFEARVDDTPVSEEVLNPGWSAYEWRVRYRSFDVKPLLTDSTVHLSVTVGNGWYRGRLGFTGAKALYGDRLGLIAQLEMTYADGHRQVVVTDESWVVSGSDILANDLYDGQTIDARRRPGDVDQQPESVLPVRRLDFDPARLFPYVGPPVTRQEVIRPVEIWRSPTGRTLLDFGQNIVGWLRFTVRGPRGSEIRVRHAEVLEGGELGTRPLRDAQATDRLILSGREDHFEPTFTFHGFRYAEITGWPEEAGPVTPQVIEGVVVHSALRRTGHFECSNELLNQLHRNVVWSTRDNFLDLPTDCPQRNERLGWTGDIAVFTPSAAFLFDVGPFLSDWLIDLALEQQHAHGLVPYVVPDVLKLIPAQPHFPAQESTAIWGDAAVWVPWAMYEAYGDPSVLARQFDSMTAHVRRAAGLLSPNGLWDSGFQFGDWLDPDAPADNPIKSKADSGVVATACLYRSAALVTRAAAVLGRLEEAAHFKALAGRLRAAFNDHYVDAHGVIVSDCTTVYTLAIAFGLLDEPTQQRAGDRLAQLVQDSGHHISTGFAGTPYITEALTRTGHLDTAYALLMQTECPSWLYPVTMGATTIWERWDSMLPDGSINPGEMTSFNHYALGAVAAWMHQVVGGMVSMSPGYRTVRLAPRPGGGLTWAATSLRTPYGELSLRWELRGEHMVVDAVVPAGVDAEFVSPRGDVIPLDLGSSHLEVLA